ncbi:hypothetical protein [Spiroplasma eriocheiris]|uniref:Uncharacterized protein n=1 Tax=Spiroplasma eriocheiris TaxID=315358 RepID=A0A0H3XKB9_9MOLU|nr:hypothetical protein [Spiroplasma eriocheiris]AHF57373.1 hypothetical protein SPE_0240 [Spiroplasma eriocheiris CCTCC M 207170]AKM53829.1 hypothetical protein SERIO_v1c02430 [Spiroplasma eriocheiris]
MNWWYVLIIVVGLLLIFVFIWQGMIGAKSMKIWTVDKMQKLIRLEIRQNLIDEFDLNLRNAKIVFTNYVEKRNYWSVIEKYLVEIHCTSEIDNRDIIAKYAVRYHTKIVSRGMLEKRMMSLKLLSYSAQNITKR